MKGILKKIIPVQLKRKIYATIVSQIKENNKIQSSLIPTHPLKYKTIENTKLLLNREDLLKMLPKEGIVAELGVDEGHFSELILKTCHPKKMILVDFWGSKRFNQNKRKSVEEKFTSQIKSGKVQIEIGYSTDVGGRFQDNYFDWIYIDTDHSYKTTIEELEVWRPKVKEHGIITGHDYIIGNWNSMIRYGVIEAVHEFCLKYDWEIIYLTMDQDIKPSFAIRKIKKVAKNP